MPKLARWKEWRVGTFVQNRYWLAAVLIFAVIVGREVAIRRGLVYGSDRLALLTVAAAGLVLLIGAFFLRTLSTFAMAIGAATALIALFQLGLPHVSDAPTAAACPGAQVRGVDFLATTHPNGVNARAGPGRSFEQVERFQGECSLGFVGYCLGEPVLDLFALPTFEVPDIRWFVLPRQRGYISGGVLQLQDPLSDLALNEDCPQVVPTLTPPRLTDPSPREPLRGEVQLVVQAPGAPNVGFAAYHESRGMPSFTRIGLDSFAADGFSVFWNTGAQETGARFGKRSVAVMAVVCLAAESPTQLVDIVVFQIGNGVGRGLDTAELPPSVVTRLRGTACLLPE